MHKPTGVLLMVFLQISGCELDKMDFTFCLRSDKMICNNRDTRLKKS